MQQVLQPIDGRATEVARVPTPCCGPREILIANRFSLLSAGTERSTVHLARQSLVGKARNRPDHVRRVLEKLRQEGLASTIRQVRARLAQPMPLGYSSAGVVVDVGEEVQGFAIGDRVASNGPHAEVVAVPKHLAARVPDEVPLDAACYAVLGSIALQGVRLARVGLGDVVAVIGLGLVGQLAVSLLKAAGCTVLGTDPDPSKRDLALALGADGVAVGDAFARAALARGAGHGADAVVVAASTPSNGPIELAAAIARPKARVVLIGAVGMNVPRREFYPKELELVVSCSYGPGRYDRRYEDMGEDYPYAHVRWTEQRNIAAVLELMARGRLPVEKLTTHRFEIERAADAYELIESGRERHVGILLEYPEAPVFARRAAVPSGSVPSRATSTGREPIGVSVVGAGSFASGVLVPALVGVGVRRRGVASARGLSAKTLAEKHRFDFAAADIEEVLADSETDAVLIATRHDQHTPMALAALRAGKHVFLEKPLAISEDQLELWREWFAESPSDRPILTVGYNRRFSPAVGLLIEQLRKLPGPWSVTIRMNAGPIPSDHWIHDPRVGGGRIVGEACHAVDLATCLIGSPPVRVHSESLRERGGPIDDACHLALRHADGSLSTIVYISVGERAAGKERIEVMGSGLAAFLDDFRRLEIHRRGKRILRKSWWSARKGHAEELHAFLDAVRSGRPPIGEEELVRGAAACLAAVRSARLGIPLEVE